MRGADNQNYLFDPPTSRRTEEPGGGEMETGRGKKVKKASWHLTLRLKDAIFTGIGIVGLMSLSFALGALAGRGDIYRAASTWGLMSPEAKPAAQVIPPVALAPPAAAPTAEAPPAPVAAVPAAPAAPAAAPAPTAHVVSAAAKPTHPAPIAGSMVPQPAPAAAAPSKKRAKAAQAQHEQKVKEDQLHQERQEVARKLTFLNSFDSSPKPKKDKDKTKAAAAKPQTTQVKVATYRDSKTAKAKQAELQKKGVKVTLKQGKDGQGVCYTLYRQAPAAPPKESDNLTQRKEKTGAAAPGQ